MVSFENECQEKKAELNLGYDKYHEIMKDINSMYQPGSLNE
jgi:hypothetical protein